MLRNFNFTVYTFDVCISYENRLKSEGNLKKLLHWNSTKYVRMLESQNESVYYRQVHGLHRLCIYKSKEFEYLIDLRSLNFEMTAFTENPSLHE